MKAQTLLLSLATLLFFGCNTEESVAPHDPIVGKQTQQQIDPSAGYATTPKSFSAFLWPDVYDWDLDIFPRDLPYEEKYALAVENVGRLSGTNDVMQGMIVGIDIDIANIDREMDRLGCNQELSDFNCVELARKKTILKGTKLKLQGRQLGNITSLLKILDKNIKRPRNWHLPYPFKVPPPTKKSSFEFSENGPIISIVNFGTNRMDYSTQGTDDEDPTIVDVELDGIRNRLSFSLLEKDAFGNLTGYSYQFRLNIREFLGDLRLTGNMHKFNRAGTRVREGNATINFARIR